jgi:hypothetical protein
MFHRAGRLRLFQCDMLIRAGCEVWIEHLNQSEVLTPKLGGRICPAPDLDQRVRKIG